MKSDTPLDFALFQLSPRRMRCELFVSGDGVTEKLASGLLKPFVSHLKVAEEQVALSVQSIKLEAERRKSSKAWFTKGTVERFVRFVGAPEVLELVNTSDAEMCQLEAARRIYSQESEEHLSDSLGNGGTHMTSTTDATKKELLRAIDLRLVAVKQDLATACAHAAAAGFNPDTVLELQMFADCFGAHLLNEACSKFIALCERRMDLINPLRAELDDHAVRSSCGSDMSIDIDFNSPEPHISSDSHLNQHQQDVPENRHILVPEQNAKEQHCNEHSKASSSEQPKIIFPVRICKDLNEKKEGTNRENDRKKNKGESSGQDGLSQTVQASRRLSVQDRINMFENKQKENSGTGGKPMATKSSSVELRRLSSDLSSASGAAEKAVLRRWSCASDMSIDLSAEKKDGESPLPTPSSASVTLMKLEGKGLNDGATSPNPDIKRAPGIAVDDELKHLVDSKVQIEHTSGGEEVGNKVGAKSDIPRSSSASKTFDSNCQKDQTNVMVQSKSIFNRTQDSSSKDKATSQSQIATGSRGEQIAFLYQEKAKSCLGVAELGGSKTQVPSGPQIGGHKFQSVHHMPYSTLESQSRETRSGDELHQYLRAELPKQEEDSDSKAEFVPQLHPKVHAKLSIDSDMLDGNPGSKIKEAFVSQLGAGEVASSSQFRWRPSGETNLSRKHLSSSTTKAESSGLPKMKFQKQVSPESVNKSVGRNEESKPIFDNGKKTTGRVTSEVKTTNSTTSVPVIQFQRARHSKGNQELNDELKRKANELENLFAEHQLRVPGDQPNSTRRGKPAEVEIEQTSSSSHKQAEELAQQYPDKISADEPSENSIMKTGASQDYNDILPESFSERSFSEDLRGKFYDRYMQKRDAKLREEWDSKREEKEAKMKAMQASFEKSRAEMTANFSESADRQNSVLTDRRRAERLKSFNSRSTLKREQHLDFAESEDDGDLSFGDGISRSSIQGKRLLPNKNSSSSTPRSLAAPVPRSTIKASNSISGRRKMSSENPLAQSVPNFSDLRKENTKPFSADGKMTTRQQLRNYPRSKSTTEDSSFVKAEKAQHSQSLRKSSASPSEFKEMTPLSSEDMFTPLKLDKGQTDQCLYEKYLKHVDSKPFHSKNNVKLRASIAMEAINNEKGYGELVYQGENEVDLTNNGVQFANVLCMTNNDHVHDETSKNIDKLQNSGSENGEPLESFSKVDPSVITELPAAVTSTFYPLGSAQDSPEESPMSWNSRMHHPFAYQNETSDIDASVDSPIGSPASWNSHSFNQTDNDVTRMRKKWGTAQKPFLVANSSQNQSRKDMAKGFKRLLKFGRKNRGSENMADWISATTSEGDDDTEDGRDPANRSSEDLRKSRMGFSRGNHDESFNENEFLSEQVQAVHTSIPNAPPNFRLREDHLSGSSMKAPRSFFSLSSFRSKASDSKPR